jgi:hypothetical protein
MNDSEAAIAGHEKALVLVLRLAGLVLLTALVPVVMPFSWMQAIHRWLGMGELPAGPIMDYLTRSLSAMYALHGALLVYVSVDIRRFLPVVKFLAVLGIVFGAGMIALDVVAGMPWWWTVNEGPFVMVLGAVLLWLARRVGVEPPANTRSKV